MAELDRGCITDKEKGLANDALTKVIKAEQELRQFVYSMEFINRKMDAVVRLKIWPIFLKDFNISKGLQ